MAAPFWETLKPLYGVSELQGYADADIAALKERFGALPAVLEEYYRAAGRTAAFHHVQDTWMLPEDFQRWEWLQRSEYLTLLVENQGVCRAGIRREDLCLPDPPVYESEDEGEWALCAPAVSVFLPAALAYESVIGIEFAPCDFFWLTEEELSRIRTGLTQLPYSFGPWISGMKITLYQNAPDNLAAILECEDGELQMLYGAASEASYQKLMTVLKGIGEPL